MPAMLLDTVAHIHIVWVADPLSWTGLEIKPRCEGKGYALQFRSDVLLKLYFMPLIDTHVHFLYLNNLSIKENKRK